MAIASTAAATTIHDLPLPILREIAASNPRLLQTSTQTSARAMQLTAEEVTGLQANLVVEAGRGGRALKKAARAGRVDVIKSLVQKGLMPDREEIFAAANYGHPSAAAELIIAAWDMDDHLAWDTLGDAAEAGNERAVRTLMSAGVTLVQRHLNSAARGGNAKLVRFMLDAGLEPTGSALWNAAFTGNVRAVQTLCRAGAPRLSDILYNCIRTANSESEWKKLQRAMEV
jgi:urease gamma subunit